MSDATTIDKCNPRNGNVLYTVTNPSSDEISAVMDRAQAAHIKVSAMTVQQRAAEAMKLKKYIVENKHKIAQIIVEENGKSLLDAMVGDIFSTLDLIDFYAGKNGKNSVKILADQKVHTPLLMMGKKSKIYYNAIGPVLVISPWNYPLNTALTPAICAFMAGNSVIIKPSEWTPLLGVLEPMLKESGFIQDGIQVVAGDRETGKALVESKPAKIFFTGSVRGGKAIMEHASHHLIPVELELGGKDPMVVFGDANLERATNGAVWGALNNTGQGCTSVERCFVEESLYEPFVAKLKEKFAKLSSSDRWGDKPDEGNMDLGAITTPFQLETIRAQVEGAKAQGADVWTAYEPIADAPNYPPTIITNVTDDMDIQREETFGPTITIMPFKGEEEAVCLANDTIYGLSSSVWSSDLEKADRVARRIEAGNVCINDVMVTEGNAALPFGGVKQSGIGRYKSTVGLHNFCNIKSIMVDGGKKPTEGHWYPYSHEKYNLLAKVIDDLAVGGLGGLIRLLGTGSKLDGHIKKNTL